MPHGIISSEKINIIIDQQNFTEKSHHKEFQRVISFQNFEMMEHEDCGSLIPRYMVETTLDVVHIIGWKPIM